MRFVFALIVVTLFASSTLAQEAQQKEPVQKESAVQKDAVQKEEPTQKSFDAVVVTKGSLAYQVCLRKARIQAARGGRCFHPGGSFAGLHYEGVGSGSTAAQALGNCCYTGKRRCAASAVVRGSNGRYYACKLFY